MNHQIPRQLKAYWKRILIVVIISTALLGSAIWAMTFPGVDDYHLFSDPIDVLGGKPYFGLYSQLGLFLWAACAAMCFFAAACINKQGLIKEFWRYLIACGI